MAYYAYKQVRDLLPQHIIDKQGPDYQADSNYDGDMWDAAADYINELIAERDTLRAELGDLPEAQAEMLAEIKRLRAQLDEIAATEPDAVRYGFDGYGWMYVDNGSGSNWLDVGMKKEDGEPLFTRPVPAQDVTELPSITRTNAGDILESIVRRHATTAIANAKGAK